MNKIDNSVYFTVMSKVAYESKKNMTFDELQKFMLTKFDCENCSLEQIINLLNVYDYNLVCGYIN